MLIINADDWGRLPEETDATLRCAQARRVTSVSAMVLMADSVRAAAMAKEHGLDVGLHVNFAEPFTGTPASKQTRENHARIIRFLTGTKYSQIIYHPFLRSRFADLFALQIEEFVRLYDHIPSHIDGHHHLHLCANVVWDRIVPAGSKMRRNFSFWPGEKSFLNRVYRRFVDASLARRYRLTDYFFCLLDSIRRSRFKGIMKLAVSNHVELMTHPIVVEESTFLLGRDFVRLTEGIEMAGYAAL